VSKLNAGIICVHAYIIIVIIIASCWRDGIGHNTNSLHGSELGDVWGSEGGDCSRLSNKQTNKLRGH
jgi:hypothetical protein